MNETGFDANRPTIVALLYLAGFVVGVTSLIGLVLAYVWRGEAGGNWEASHYRFHIRTFWLGLLASIVAGVLTLVLIGWLGILAIAVWMLIRTVKAMTIAQKRLPIDDPATLLW